MLDVNHDNLPFHIWSLHFQGLGMETPDLVPNLRVYDHWLWYVDTLSVELASWRAERASLFSMTWSPGVSTLKGQFVCHIPFPFLRKVTTG